MAKVALATVGCRLNQYETEKIADALGRMGMIRVRYNQTADLYILNTCTVTGRADADCRKLIHRAHRQNPSAVLVVTGCYAVAEKDTVSQMDGVDLVIGNQNKADLAQIIYNHFPQLFTTDVDDYHSLTVDDEAIIDVHPPHRPMVQIGTGCNQNCSYCIVPKVRGPLASFSSERIIDEISELIMGGYQEVVLTAVHIGKYSDNELSLLGLVKKILEETELPRLRLSSLEPNELNDELLDLVAGEPRVCRHLHLPLQSGADRVLKRMRRPYRRDDFLSLVEKTKKKNDKITIGCDVIVGFPGETDIDFQQTMEILQSGYIDYGHIFSYSDRPGTGASQMREKIHPGIIKERNYQARMACERNKHNHALHQCGHRLEVISERTPGRDGLYRAVSDNYLRVKLPQFIGGQKRIIPFTPQAFDGDCLIGSVPDQI